MPKPKIQVFAIIRIDSEPPPGLPAGGPGVDPSTLVNRSIAEVTVTSILPTTEAALEEVERLNRLNSTKGARYYWMATRYYPEGKAHAEREEESSSMPTSQPHGGWNP